VQEAARAHATVRRYGRSIVFPVTDIRSLRQAGDREKGVANALISTVGSIEHSGTLLVTYLFLLRHERAWRGFLSGGGRSIELL